jgi:diguanylate cyclase (GGDEF)-like protein
VRELDPSGPADPLAAAIRAVGRGDSLDSALDVIMRSAMEGQGATLALIVATNDDGPERRVLRSHGLAEGDVALVESATGDAADPLAVAAAEHRIVKAVAAGPRSGPGERGLVDRLGLARLEALPLVVARDGIDRVVGVLALGWSTTPPTPPAEQGTPVVQGAPGLADALADLAAIAIDRAHLSAGMAERAEWMERLAHIDPLTGLANRRTFDRVLELELARAARQQSEVAVAVFDIDAFRATNDAAGHAAGDDVLRAVAAVIAEQVRLVDTVARIGGDEFVVVAPGNGGPAVAERVIRAIRALPAVDGRRVSVSAGIARFPVDGASPEEIVAGALDALEAARRGGIGTVASAPAPG